MGDEGDFWKDAKAAKKAAGLPNRAPLSALATITDAEVDALMKRCQIGVGGRNALDQAHDIMAECYGTLGALRIERNRLREVLRPFVDQDLQYLEGIAELKVQRAQVLAARDALKP